MIKNFQVTNYFLMLALGATLIGFAPIFVKWSNLSPAAITFWRMLLALPLLAGFNYAVNKKIFFKVKSKKTIFYAALASLAFTTDLTLWHYSMNITSVANATIIVNSAPVFVALLAFIFYKELPTKGFGKSFLITYTGIIGLIIFSNNYANGKILGDFLCMIAALFYAIYLLIISKLNKETSLNIIFYTTFFCCLFSIVPMLMHSKSFLPISSFEWINLLLMAFLCQFGGQFLITFGIGKISASNGSIGLLMQPLTATLLAALIFSEILNLMQILFVFITLIGIYFARLSIVK
ncbi:DMT family transporter [Gammaproteobacteria bacterium]|jgi:drug/metabolite transporter (DMT)-like permease|nr:DMT family transporter [Gammaproteobacteria bacterium]